MNDDDNVYMITIQATVRKTLQVVATNEDEAKQVALESFTPNCDGYETDYQEDILEVQEVG